MKTSVLILNWNSSDETIRLHSEIKKLNAGFNVTVIDNSSRPKDQENLRRHIPSEDFIQSGKNLGYSWGNNFGLRKAIENGYDCACILNPDILIKDNFISPLVSQLETNPQIAAIGPRVCYREREDTIYSDGGVVDLSGGFHTRHQHYNKPVSEVPAKVRDVDYVHGGAMLLNLKAVKDVGLLDESLFMYFDEVEWCLRAKQAGWRLVADPRVTVFHLTSPKGPAYHFYMVRNRIWVAKRFGRGRPTLTCVARDLYYELRQNLARAKWPGNHFMSRIRGFLSGLLSQ
ncbi:MAG: glycosyltransferase family 2 protein [Bdellovibrionota bacterium]